MAKNKIIIKIPEEILIDYRSNIDFLKDYFNEKTDSKAIAKLINTCQSAITKADKVSFYRQALTAIKEQNKKLINRLKNERLN